MSIALPFLTCNPATLMAKLACYQSHWHSFWLNDDNHPVIGILPKVRWHLTPNTKCNKKNHTATPTFVLHTQKRTHSYHDEQCMVDYKTFIQILLAYQADKTPHRFNNTQRKPITTTNHKTHYKGGLMGYIGYDITAAALNATITMGEPLAYFGHYDCYLCKQDGQWFYHSPHPYNTNTSSNDTHNNDTNDNHTNHIIHTLKTIATLPTPTPTPITLSPTLNLSQYQQRFDDTIRFLTAGDAYQVNLTFAFMGQSQAPLSPHLPTLFAGSHAPFAGYLAFDNHEILSMSPELFLQFEHIKSNQTQSHKQSPAIGLTAKPIKGTRPRGKTPIDDERLKNELKYSTKDLAENVMIVDLLRNDLGRYAKFGAVSVPKKFAIESFSNVHHMVSTITAELSDTPALKVLFDSLPAGSITGSPKKRACELIYQLEHHPRGAYCGTMGYLNFDDTGRWNVLIRTLQSHKQNEQYTLQAWAGGGITVLSNSDDEYQECFHKIKQICTIIAKPNVSNDNLPII